MCAVCLHALSLSCSPAVCWSSGSRSNCRGSLLFFVWQRRRQFSLLCYDVIGCWLWNTSGNENLIEPESWELHIVTASPAGLVLSVYLMTDPWEIHFLSLILQCLNSPPVCCWARLCVLTLTDVIIALSVLTEDIVSESAPCWGPQRPPASSVEMLHVSTRPAILCQHHQQW